MVALNSVTIAGNLTDDPELRFTPNGNAVSNFTVASTPRRLNKSTQEWEDGETLFMRVTAWGQMSENIAESLRKGHRVLVTGRLEQRNWEDEEGNKRSNFELIADDVAPSLLFAQAEVTRNEKKQSTVTPRPAKKTTARKTTTRTRAQDDEPPY